MDYGYDREDFGDAARHVSRRRLRVRSSPGGFRAIAAARPAASPGVASSRRTQRPVADLDDVRPLTLRPVVVRYTREGKLWNESIARYHYLGYKTLVGAQMRYAVYDRDGWPSGMLGFSTAARKLAPRDRFIGWTPEKREKNLPS